jgi:hypothetical protein
MGYLRPIAIAATLAIGLCAAGPASAGSNSMAGGSVQFSTPDTWLEILQTDGDPETLVFQVPDPSPTGQAVLARISVTVKQEPDIAGFQAYVSQANAKAAALPGYQAAGKGADPNAYSYTAREAGVPAVYRELYWYKDGHAIQLRCLRPQQSKAGAGWISAFDKGCEALAAQLK